MRPVAYLPILLGFAPVWVNAQIIYTNVIPDQVYNWDNDTSLIDLDDDGQLDLMIRYVRDSVGPSCPAPCLPGGMMHPCHVFVDPMPGNQIADSVNAYVSELSSGDTLDGSLLWGADAGQLLVEYVAASCVDVGPMWLCVLTGHNGNWGPLTGETGFIGVQFLIGGAIHYGWVRLSVHRNAVAILDFTLMDYAYNSMPNEPIAAGDTLSITTGVPGVDPGFFGQFFPNPFSTSTTLLMSEVPREGCMLKFLDLSGREVRSIMINSDRTTIDRGTMDCGFYFYEITSGPDRLTSGKVLIE